jgi:hypothetical protein
VTTAPSKSTLSNKGCTAAISLVEAATSRWATTAPPSWVMAASSFSACPSSWTAPRND